MKHHYPGCQTADECTCDAVDDLYENQDCTELVAVLDLLQAVEPVATIIPLANVIGQARRGQSSI